MTKWLEITQTCICTIIHLRFFKVVELVPGISSQPGFVQVENSLSVLHQAKGWVYERCTVPLKNHKGLEWTLQLDNINFTVNSLISLLGESNPKSSPSLKAKFISICPIKL